MRLGSSQMQCLVCPPQVACTLHQVHINSWVTKQALLLKPFWLYTGAITVNPVLMITRVFSQKVGEISCYCLQRESLLFDTWTQLTNVSTSLRSWVYKFYPSSNDYLSLQHLKDIFMLPFDHCFFLVLFMKGQKEDQRTTYTSKVHFTHEPI